MTRMSRLQTKILLKLSEIEGKSIKEIDWYGNYRYLLNVLGEIEERGVRFVPRSFKATISRSVRNLAEKRLVSLDFHSGSSDEYSKVRNVHLTSEGREFVKMKDKEIENKDDFLKPVIPKRSDMARDIGAKMQDISTECIRKVEFIQDHNDGKDFSLQDLRTGEISINKAYRITYGKVINKIMLALSESEKKGDR